MTVIELLSFDQFDVGVVLKFEDCQHLLSLLVLIIEIFRFSEWFYLVRACVLYSWAWKWLSSASAAIRAAYDWVNFINNNVSLKVSD